MTRAFRFALPVLLAVAVVTGGTTYALFTDTESVDGTISIDVPETTGQPVAVTDFMSATNTTQKEPETGSDDRLVNDSTPDNETTPTKNNTTLNNATPDNATLNNETTPPENDSEPLNETEPTNETPDNDTTPPANETESPGTDPTPTNDTSTPENEDAPPETATGNETESDGATTDETAAGLSEPSLDSEFENAEETAASRVVVLST